MKTKITLAILSIFMTAAVFAQRKASVYAANSDISDNLDLRAVASIFGESKDLSDFEYRLNDPTLQISNLDLNNDNQVDYLRVIEMVQDNSHLVVIQSVLQEDVYQDVATIALSKKKNKQVHIQIIGDPYMYGSNYIYEPIFIVRPPLYSNFWVTNYRPYRSYYGWNRYPTFYRAWSPYSYNIYHQNVYVHINHNNYYNYSNTIYNSNANNYYHKYRSNGYEQKYPHRDFAHRTSQTNKYEYDRVQREGNARNPQTVSGLRSSSVSGKTISSNRPTTTATVRPSTTATARPSTSSTIRPATSSTARPSTNSMARPVTTSSSSARPSTSSSRPATTRSASSAQPSAQRSSNSSQRTSTNAQSSQQRSSGTSVRTTQQSSGSRSTTSNSGSR